MRIADLVYGGVPAWPPAWTSSLPDARVLTGHPEAILKRVTVKSTGLEIEAAIDNKVVSGLLLWDGIPAPLDVKQALDTFLHRSWWEVGSAHIPRT